MMMENVCQDVFQEVGDWSKKKLKLTFQNLILDFSRCSLSRYPYNDSSITSLYGRLEVNSRKKTIVICIKACYICRANFLIKMSPFQITKQPFKLSLDQLSLSIVDLVQWTQRNDLQITKFVEWPLNLAKQLLSPHKLRIMMT